MTRATVLNVLLVALILGVFIWTFTWPDPPRLDEEGALGDPGVDEGSVHEAYWLVQVLGAETRDPADEGSRACPTVDPYALEEENRTLRVRYAHELERIEERGVVVAYDVHEEWSGCPVAYGLAMNPEIERDLGHYEGFSLSFQDDGGVRVVEEEHLSAGETKRFEYTRDVEDDGSRYRVDGWFEIVHHGEWPTSGVTVGSR